MEKAMLVEALAPFLAVGVLCISIAWVTTTWIRVKNGYPLENSWGKSVYPKNDQAVERVKLLTQENAELRSGYHLTHEIDRLRDTKDVN